MTHMTLSVLAEEEKKIVLLSAMNGVTSSFGLEHSFSYVDVLVLVELGEGSKLSAKSRDKVKLALVTLATDSRHEVLVNPRPEKYPHVSFLEAAESRNVYTREIT